MKLENQVCTYDQAVKLQELGLKQQATFFFVKTVSERHLHQNIELFFGIDAAYKQYNDWVRHDESLTSKTTPPVAAWNGMELGELLPDVLVQPRNTIDLYTYKKYNSFGSDRTRWFCSLATADLLKPRFAIEAHLRAAMLIFLIENQYINIETLNHQLFIA